MNAVAPSAPEVKGAGEAGAAELTQAYDELMTAFEAFKEGNDDRLRQIERRLSADVVTEEKVARIDRAVDEQKRLIDRLVLGTRRPQLGGREASAAEVSEHKAAFDGYVRTGDMSGLRRLEEKAMSAGSDPDGGFLVPEETETEIGRRLALVSPIRGIAGVRQVSTTTYRKPFATSGAATGWAGETEARPETASPTLVELEFPVMELYAMPAATATLLEESAELMAAGRYKLTKLLRGQRGSEHDA